MVFIYRYIKFSEKAIKYVIDKIAYLLFKKLIKTINDIFYRNIILKIIHKHQHFKQTIF